MVTGGTVQAGYRNQNVTGRQIWKLQSIQEEERENSAGDESEYSSQLTSSNLTREVFFSAKAAQSNCIYSFYFYFFLKTTLFV